VKRFVVLLKPPTICKQGWSLPDPLWDPIPSFLAANIRLVPGTLYVNYEEKKCCEYGTRLLDSQEVMFLTRIFNISVSFAKSVSTIRVLVSSAAAATTGNNAIKLFFEGLTLWRNRFGNASNNTGKGKHTSTILTKLEMFTRVKLSSCLRQILSVASQKKKLYNVGRRTSSSCRHCQSKRRI